MLLSGRYSNVLGIDADIGAKGFAHSNWKVDGCWTSTVSFFVCGAVMEIVGIAPHGTTHIAEA